MPGSRIYDMPALAERDDVIEARVYNLWRRARRKFGEPIRFPLPGLRGMELILDSRYWVCVDASQADLPVIAWVDFRDQGRDALHEPVPCHIRYYHFAASKIRADVLRLMVQELEGRLSQRRL